MLAANGRRSVHANNAAANNRAETLGAANEPNFDVRGELYRLANVDLVAIEGIEASTALVVLSEIGTDIIGSLVRGIVNAIPGLRETLHSITNLIPDWKGPEDVDRKLLEPAGRAIMAGLINGIDDGTGPLRRKLMGITDMIGGTTAMMGAPRFGLPTPVSAPTLASDPNGGAMNPQFGVKVFLGTREIEDIVDVQVIKANAQQARLITTGMRR